MRLASRVCCNRNNTLHRTCRVVVQFLSVCLLSTSIYVITVGCGLLVFSLILADQTGAYGTGTVSVSANVFGQGEYEDKLFPINAATSSPQTFAGNQLVHEATDVWLNMSRIHLGILGALLCVGGCITSTISTLVLHRLCTWRYYHTLFFCALFYIPVSFMVLLQIGTQFCVNPQDTPSFSTSLLSRDVTFHDTVTHRFTQDDFKIPGYESATFWFQLQVMIDAHGSGFIYCQNIWQQAHLKSLSWSLFSVSLAIVLAWSIWTAFTPSLKQDRKEGTPLLTSIN